MTEEENKGLYEYAEEEPNYNHESFHAAAMSNEQTYAQNMKFAEFTTFVNNKIYELLHLFNVKNQQYRSDTDFLCNFRHGAALRTGHEPTHAEMYEELKNYCANHIAHVYGHDAHGERVDENLRDIALYCILGMYFVEQAQKESRK